jgi:hypothetical protein
MKLASVLQNTGRIMRATQDYDEQQKQRAFLDKTRDYRTKVMESGVRRMEAEDSNLGQRTENEKLRLAAEGDELEFEKTLQGTVQDTKRAQARTTKVQAESAANRVAGEELVKGEQLTQQQSDLQEKQLARVYRMLQTGDAQGVIELVNKSKMLNPNGARVLNVQRGTVQVQTKDGRTAQEPVIRVEIEGRPPLMLSERRLEALVQKHLTSLEKVGSDLVRVGPGGEVSGAYSPDEFAAHEGRIYSKRTGEVKSGGPKGGLGSRWDRRFQRDIINDSNNRILKYFGASDLSGLSEEAQPKYKEMAKLAEDFVVNRGMRAAEAAQAAIDEVERKYELDTLERGAGGGGYTGPTPWK